MINVKNSYDYNYHEYLAYLLCNDLFEYHPLNEERGRIPFIQQILNELESIVTAKLDTGNNKKVGLSYSPSFQSMK